METRGSENEFNDSNNAMSRAYASKISQYKLKDQKRIFQNDRIYFDDDGKRIKDHIIYKDYVSYYCWLILPDDILLSDKQGLLRGQGTPCERLKQLD